MRLMLPTLWQLGFGSVASVFLYRLARQCGLYRYWLPVQQWNEGGDFYAPIHCAVPNIAQRSRQTLLGRADRLLGGELYYFSSTYKQIGSPPDWFHDPFTGCQISQGGHWSTFDEFSTGDIKNVWEASRFEWATLLAQAWRLTGDEGYLETINCWLLDWVTRNPTNAGPNWICGQETSIRLINLLLTAHLIGTHWNPSPNLVHLISIHCARILPTIRYAVAQNNNHGVSEAAALFIGGAWLMVQTEDESLRKDARHWRDEGRRWLENRVTALVAADGSFSQYSMNYHRVLVDTISQVEFWRAELGERPFSDRYTARCCAAVEWLAAMTDASSGNAPNLGANDGARLYNLSSAPYRDFRPSVQLASVLFRGERAYGNGEWDESILWLGRESSANQISQGTASLIHGDGGDVVLRGDQSLCLVRFARFRYRPSHADCLHLDLWHRTENILRDGGTFSYNTESQWLDYFSGTESHNTVQFDGRNQMPRLGRFLFGKWLKMDECTAIQGEGNSLSWTGAYTDWKRAWQRRTVTVCGNIWTVIDEIGGFRDKAVLRWRLMPEEWTLSGNTCDSAHAQLSVISTAPLRRLELTTGWESLYYQQKTELPVLEVEVGAGIWTIETEISLKD